jgi:hypothetical protein
VKLGIFSKAGTNGDGTITLIADNPQPPRLLGLSATD